MPSFKTQIELPPVLTVTASFPSVFSNSWNIQDKLSTFKRFRSQGYPDDKNWLDFPAFSLRFVDFTVQFCFCCKFHSMNSDAQFKLKVAWFSWTNHNSLLCITTNEITSFWVENRLCQMAFFVFTKKGKGQLSSSVERFW